MADLRVSFPRPCDQPWEAMTPVGCNRICDRCDKVIHDLSRYDIDEAETLLLRDPDSCVRARIGPDGAIVVKAGPSIRRMVVAAGASAGLVTGCTPTSVEAPPKSLPAITGTVAPPGKFALPDPTKVVATNGAGRSFRGKVRRSGRYEIKRIPAGTYTLTFIPDCGDPWKVEDVVVDASTPIVVDSANPNECIIVGKLLISDPGSEPA